MSVFRCSDQVITEDYAKVWGDRNQVKGESCTVHGDRNIISGRHSYVFGNFNTVKGDQSGAVGDDNIVTGNYCVVNGNRNKISGIDSKAIGKDNEVKRWATVKEVLLNMIIYDQRNSPEETPTEPDPARSNDSLSTNDPAESFRREHQVSRNALNIRLDPPARDRDGPTPATAVSSLVSNNPTGTNINGIAELKYPDKDVPAGSPCCVVCMSREPDVIAIPCRHKQFCGVCVVGMKNNNSPINPATNKIKCPVCNADVDTFGKVY